MPWCLDLWWSRPSALGNHGLDIGKSVGNLWEIMGNHGKCYGQTIQISDELYFVHLPKSLRCLGIFRGLACPFSDEISSDGIQSNVKNVN